MCGIAGCVVAPGQSPDREALDRMVAALDRRGPDDRGVVVRDNVGLASTRLAIVDPSPAGHQPMENGDWLLAYNGEIYNHMELRRDLGSANGWRGHSDTETLLHALAAWGPETVERCNGAFAFAAMDRSRRQLILARDRFGKKPLYFARRDGAVWFASEIRALLAAGIPARADRELLAHATSNGYAYGRQTPLAGVRRMLPGTLATIGLDHREVAEEPWFDLANVVDPELARELKALPRERLADRLEEALRGSVRRRLMSDVPLGSMCSGGVDSSLVTALAHEEAPGFVAFNCVLVGQRWADESRWAQQVAQSIGVELETVEITVDEWLAALVEAVRLHEYPPAGPGSVPISLIAARARQRGIKVLLTGEGADEMFWGYPIERELRRRFLPLHVSLHQRCRALAASRRFGLRRRIRLWRERRHPTDLGRAAECDRLLREVGERAAQAYSHHPGVRGELEANLLTRVSCSMFPYLLNRMDKDAMGHSVETRVPFLDPEVVSLALNMPLEARTMPLAKGVLRDVAARHLPRPVARRLKHAGLVFNAREAISSRARPGFLDDGVLRENLEIPRWRWAEVVAQSNARDGFRLWAGEIWARLFLEGHSVERVEQDLWAGEAPAVGPAR